MSKHFYIFAIVLISIYVTLTVAQSLIYIHLGPVLFFRHAFLAWFLFSMVLNLLMLITLLRYYYHKHYLPAFWTLVVVLTAAVFYILATYSVLTTKKLEDFYPISSLTLSCTLLLHYLSLLLKGPKIRLWLKVTGIGGMILQSVSILTMLIVMKPDLFGIVPGLENIRIWASFCYNFVPLMLVFNFAAELRHLKQELVPARLKAATALVYISVIVISVILGRNLIVNPAINSQNIKKITERAKAFADLFDARTFRNREGDSLSYRLLKPINYDSTKRYPLVVCLHHGGANGNDNVIQVEASQPAPLLSEPINRFKYPAFVFVPQCPIGATWGGVTTGRSVDSLVFQALHAIEEEFSVDENRRYIVGSSLGGFGVWHFICSRPTMFAAAVPISGGGDPRCAAQIPHVALWAFHGENDENVPVRLSREMIDLIEDNGGEPRYTEIQNVGHNIGDVVKGTPDLMDWLFDQKRK